MGRIIKKIICIFLILAGAALFFYPDVLTSAVDVNAKRTIKVFEETYPGEETGSTQTDPQMQELLETVKEYNARIYQNGQADFKDAWSYEQAPIELSGFDGEVFGYIDIPKMDIELPLYLGASTPNMLKGAAILGETSIPIGGENTNSVIAAHRGYSGIPFFRNIEDLEPGDPVYITNPWGKLSYRVDSIRIIDPNDIDAVKIQEGRDMITLLTCHPYRSSGPYRYLVYCVRDTGNETTSGKEQEKVITEHTVQIPDSSKEDILFEQLLRRICGALILGFVICTIFISLLRKIRNRHKKSPNVRRRRRR